MRHKQYNAMQSNARHTNALHGSEIHKIRIVWFGSNFQLIWVLFSWFGICVWSLLCYGVFVHLPLTALLQCNIIHAVPFGKSSYVHSKATIISNCACKAWFSVVPIRYNPIQSNAIASSFDLIGFSFCSRLLYVIYHRNYAVTAVD